MSMEELKIFKVTGEPAMSIIADMKTAPSRMKDAAEGVRMKMGADEVVWSKNGWMIGVRAAVRPKGWTQKKGNDYFSPTRRSLEGINGRISIDYVNAIGDTEKLDIQFFTGDPWYVTNTTLYRPALGWIGKTFFVTVHRDAKCEPIAGLTPVKLSEYYALKEEYTAKVGQ